MPFSCFYIRYNDRNCEDTIPRRQQRKGKKKPRYMKGQAHVNLLLKLKALQWIKISLMKRTGEKRINEQFIKHGLMQDKCLHSFIYVSHILLFMHHLPKDHLEI